MKKIFILFLACALMLTLLPAAVFAEGEANTSELWSADIPALSAPFIRKTAATGTR